MKLVVIESPYAGDVEENVRYAKRCVLDSLRRGEAPYASHLFFTQEGLLNDNVPQERELGIQAGLAWGRESELVAFYVDRGVSSGMMKGWEAVRKREGKWEIRRLDGAVTEKDRELFEPPMCFNGTKFSPIDGPVRVQIDYFKPSGKWYTTETTTWYPSSEHYSGWQKFENVVRIEGMAAVCLNTPLGYPQIYIPSGT